MRTWRLLASAALLVAVPLSLVSLPALLSVPGASAASTPTSTIDLVSQTAWVRNTSGMHVEVAIHSSIADTDLGLQVTLWSPATERDYFEQTTTGDTNGFTVIDQSAIMPLSTKGLLQANGDASVDLPLAPTTGVPGKTQKAPTNGALLTFPCTDQCPGVYPLQVSLWGPGDAATLNSFMTYLILAPTAAQTPLQFSWILQLGSTPATDPAGNPILPAADELEIKQLDNVLAQQPSASVSLALYPQFTSALATAAATKVPLSHGTDKSAAQARQVLADTRHLLALPNVEAETETFTPVDLTGMSGRTLSAELSNQFAAGKSAFSALGVKPAKGQYVASAPLSDAELSGLHANGIGKIVVPSDDVTPPPSSWIFPVWAPFFVKNTNEVADASDYYLEQHLQSSSDPVLSANQLLADLALLYFVEQPPGYRGVTLLSPIGWHPSTAFLTTVLSGLASSPMVQSDTLSRFFNLVPPGSDESTLLIRGLAAPATPKEDQLPAGAIYGARIRLAALTGLLPRTPGRIEQLSNLVLLSETAKIGSASRYAYLDAPNKELNAQASLISLPSNRTITITSLSAKIPIFIYSRAPTPLRIDLVLSSNTLSFRHRYNPLVLQPGNNSIEIPISARTSGDFTLSLTATTMPGAFTLTSGKLTIRSTAISGVAVALTAGAGAFLLVWWARSAVKRRRTGKHAKAARRPRTQPAPGRTPTTTAT
ncbi:MAG: hypothetical protein ACLPQS_09055 [Acidimicrobiales bacterium]